MAQGRHGRKDAQVRAAAAKPVVGAVDMHRAPVRIPGRAGQHRLEIGDQRLDGGPSEGDEMGAEHALRGREFDQFGCACWRGRTARRWKAVEYGPILPGNAVEHGFALVNKRIRKVEIILADQQSRNAGVPRLA